MTVKVRARDSVPSPGANLNWSDDRLVRACLRGNEEAWAALVDKYRNLIFSIPIKYGVSREDAADLFQNVCLEMLSELPNLRNAGAIRSWLITVTVRKTFRWKRRMRRRLENERPDENHEELGETATAALEFIQDLERAQMVREAVARLSPRCNELIKLLFYEQPPVPYSEVAQRLSLALGSIGFVRGRCLERLEKLLGQLGFN